MRIGRLRFSAAHRKRVPRRKLYWVFRLESLAPPSLDDRMNFMRLGYTLLHQGTIDYGRVHEVVCASATPDLPSAAELIGVMTRSDCFRRFGS